MLQSLWRRLRRDEHGFTLIELLIVVAIIAILAAILIPNFLRARAQSQVSASKGNLKNIGTALESYFVDAGYYPAALTDLTAAAKQYIRQVPNDPCLGSTTGYTFTITAGTGGVNASNYELKTQTWSGTSQCANIVSGLYYTPSGGLGVTP